MVGEGCWDVMPSGNEWKRSKVNGDNWGGSRAQMGKRPLFSARNRRSEEKERPLRRSNSQAIIRGSAGARWHSTSAYRPDGHRVLTCSSPKLPYPTEPPGSCRVWANQDMLTYGVEEGRDQECSRRNHGLVLMEDLAVRSVMS